MPKPQAFMHLLHHIFHSLKIVFVHQTVQLLGTHPPGGQWREGGFSLYLVYYGTGVRPERVSLRKSSHLYAKIGGETPRATLASPHPLYCVKKWSL